MVSRKVKMGEHRMFALKIIDSDAFLDMSASAQNLYFHLAMRADDDGFISAPKKIMRIIGASIDDLRLLAEKRFILTFDTGIVVIKHWRIHNYIAKDRYTPTVYKEEKEKLFIKSNGAYTDHECGDDGSMYTPCIQVDNKPSTKRIQTVNKPSTDSTQNVDTSKDKLSKDKISKSNIQKPAASDVPTEATTLSQLLVSLHQSNIDSKYNPACKQVEKWAEDIDKLNRLDGRSWKEIEEVIRWVKTSGNFWAANIMSGSKLREKFPTLTAQCRSPSQVKGAKPVLSIDRNVDWSQYKTDWADMKHDEDKEADDGSTADDCTY